ncbi:guanylate kinase [Leptotrichia trevisanii]|uniref:Guanylate kinase n=2 Tax=Leptotrichia trevisanii TaxID=109328 RepID=A0A510L372_9FUSO|nr:guanylate kinase [Leptotrichia trevisanii]BBM58007.1 guanylate kinase [Leptotrichia trevisanii]
MNFPYSYKKIKGGFSMKGKLIIVSGPSGSGKSTVTKLVKDRLNIPLSISATTRQPRVGEIDGKDYFFLTREIFEQKIKNDEFYEYANVHGNYYGTLKEVVESNLNKGLNVILEIDVQGALIAKKKKKDAILVFFRTKDMETLENRLRNRKTDSEEVIQLRLKNAAKELEYEPEYDYTIINNDIEQSCKELINIINS